MAKSKNTIDKKLQKAVKKSTTAKKTSSAKVGRTPTKHSEHTKGGTSTNGKTKKTPSANENETLTKHSTPKTNEMPKNPYVPSSKNSKNGFQKNNDNGNETPTKHSSPQASGTPKNPYVPSPKNSKNGSPKNDDNGEKVKDLHKILILYNADGTPFGWAFLNFYDIKEWLKSLCNRDGSLTSLGNETFQPFTNLIVRWVITSELADKIWIIYIDTTKNEMEGSFPVSAHVLYANKIARAVLSSNVQWVPGTFEVTEHKLTESQEEDLNRQVDAKIAPTHAVREQELFLQQIASCDAMLESLI